MLDIEKIKSSEYFIEKTLSSGEILFDEGEIDNNLYYVLSGKLSVEKYIGGDKKEINQLAYLKNGEFLGEGSLGKIEPKKVRIKSLGQTKILFINSQTDFVSFMKNEPELAKDILVQIIDISNKRVLDSNNYITALYEINNFINNLEKINYPAIFELIEKINGILHGDYLLFLESNPINDHFSTLKYDTRDKDKMQDILLEKGHYKLEKIGINKKDNIMSKDIKLGKEILGNIIISKINGFNQNEKRIFVALINSLSGILKQKRLLEEEINKSYNEY